MQTWFKCVVNYLKIDDDGRERRVYEPYLVDAVSYTDAEARITKQCSEMIRGEFKIKQITQTQIIEIFPGDGDLFFLGKIQFVTIDEKAGKEKTVTNQMLIEADDFDKALKALKEGLNYVAVSFQITHLAVSNIVDVFPYSEEIDKLIPNKLIPIEDDYEG